MLRCFPDLAGRLSDQGLLSPYSAEEHKSAGLDRLTASEKQQLRYYNNFYKTKFKFPFVICARQNKKDAILKGIEERLHNSKEQELQKGIEEVKKICFLRIEKVVHSSKL